MRYIDAKQLTEAIEKKRNSLLWGACSAQVTMENNCKSAAYDEILDIIKDLSKDSHKYVCLDTFKKTLKKYCEQMKIEALGCSNMLAVGKWLAYDKMLKKLESL